MLMFIVGATWAPSSVSYGGNNRSVLIRVPDSKRFDFLLFKIASSPASAMIEQLFSLSLSLSLLSELSCDWQTAAAMRIFYILSYQPF